MARHEKIDPCREKDIGRTKCVRSAPEESCHGTSPASATEQPPAADRRESDDPSLCP